MTGSHNLFFELIQLAIGQRVGMSKLPSAQDWEILFATAQKQAVVGVMLSALGTLEEAGAKPPKSLLLKWIGLGMQIECQNKICNQRCKEIYQLFADGGYRSCILKGQGSALYYNRPAYRQSGDIDLWVEGERDNILAFVKGMHINIRQVDIKHSDMEFFEDVPVEIHFLPSWLYNPFLNKKLQAYFNKNSSAQFDNYDGKAGFAHTTVDFDLVFSMVHIYRHIFDEGIGLRQMLDYYYILKHSNKKQREEAIIVMSSLGMKSFIGGIMYVLRKCFDMEVEYLLCEENERHGKHLLSEILIGGNFGCYDTRYEHQLEGHRFSNGIKNMRRNVNFLCYYPSEVLWSPVWKVWHWGWRKWKGYL